MLTKIRNAQAVNKETTSIAFSNLKYNLAKILEKEGFIEEVKKKGKDKKRIVIKLKYQDGTPRIHGLKTISKPGRHIYLKKKRLYSPKKGYGVLVISTPKGILTSKEARKQNVGGEVLFEIW
jgi:small subunit ribosomal protein S8